MIRFVAVILLFSVNLQLVAHPLIDRILQRQAVVLRHGPMDTSDAHEKLSDSIQRGISFEIDGNIVLLDGRYHFINGHAPDCYESRALSFPCREDLRQLHPSLLFVRILEAGIPVKCDFKSPQAIEPFAYCAQVLPEAQKIGHAFIRELVIDGFIVDPVEELELLTFAELAHARRLVGADVPFVVSCTGLTSEQLTPSVVREFASKVAGQAECIQYCLPGRKNISVELARIVWEEFGLISEMRIDSQEELVFWSNQGIPWIGTTDDPELATILIMEK